MIYLDHNATTAVHPAVMARMIEVLKAGPGNASSSHGPGRIARQQAQQARAETAALIGAEADQIVFTGSGTEACNLAIFGAVAARGGPAGVHLVVSAQEHHAVLNAVAALASAGAVVTQVAPDRQGRVSARSVTEALRPETVLVSIMHANNETGVVQPIAEIGEAVRRHGALFHTDAVQSVGKLTVSLADLPVDLLSLSAHKLYGPQGVGALYVSRRELVLPRIVGGGQEEGLRAGTTNLAGIVGLGEAARLARSGLGQRAEYVATLRDLLEAEIVAHHSEARIIGAGAVRVPNTSLVCFPGRRSADLLAALEEEGVVASGGAACAAQSPGHLSHVLQAIGIPDEMSGGAVRFSLGHENTEAEMRLVAQALAKALGRRGRLARALVGRFALNRRGRQDG